MLVNYRRPLLVSATGTNFGGLKDFCDSCVYGDEMWAGGWASGRLIRLDGARNPN